MSHPKPYLQLMADEPCRCEPAARCNQRETCARASAELPERTWWTPVIDASRVDWPDGYCPMFVDRRLSAGRSIAV